ncbi:MAG: hypothetical protein LRS46_03750 [Desulfurococcales archaeon]|nr:hypothetical protein [Desulfurococcales archaeon]
MSFDGGEPYKCGNPPCLHVVLDRRRRIFKIFLEDYDGLVIPVPLQEIKRVCSRLRELSGFREASGEEIDYLARKYLEAEPENE